MLKFEYVVSKCFPVKKLVSSNSSCFLLLSAVRVCCCGNLSGISAIGTGSSSVATTVAGLQHHGVFMITALVGRIKLSTLDLTHASHWGVVALNYHGLF